MALSRNPNLARSRDLRGASTTYPGRCRGVLLGQPWVLAVVATPDRSCEGVDDPGRFCVGVREPPPPQKGLLVSLSCRNDVVCRSTAGNTRTGAAASTLCATAATGRTARAGQLTARAVACPGPLPSPTPVMRGKVLGGFPEVESSRVVYDVVTAAARRRGRGHRVILREIFHNPLEEKGTAMTAKSSIDPAEFLHEHLAQASPDLLRELMQGFVNTLLSADADSVCGAAYGARDAGADQPAQRLPPPRPRHPDRDPGRGDPEAAGGLLLPRVAARAPASGRSSTDLGGGDLLPARGLHPADGPAGAVAGHHRSVEVAGLGDGPRPRRAGPRLPRTPARRGPVHVRGRGRVDDEGPRGRPGHQDRGHGRHRRQRRRVPRDPRRRHLHQRVRGRLEHLLQGPRRPRPERGRAGHLRCPHRPGRRDRREPARRVLATLPHPLHRST